MNANKTTNKKKINKSEKINKEISQDEEGEEVNNVFTICLKRENIYAVLLFSKYESSFASFEEIKDNIRNKLHLDATVPVYHVSIVIYRDDTIHTVKEKIVQGLKLNMNLNTNVDINIEANDLLLYYQQTTSLNLTQLYQQLKIHGKKLSADAPIFFANVKYLDDSPFQLPKTHKIKNQRFTSDGDFKISR